MKKIIILAALAVSPILASAADSWKVVKAEERGPRVVLTVEVDPDGLFSSKKEIRVMIPRDATDEQITQRVESTIVAANKPKPPPPPAFDAKKFVGKTGKTKK